VALENFPVFLGMMACQLIICSNASEELAVSLFTVYLVNPGFYVSEWTIESECKIKEMKICAAIEIK
jgi:hypothetical protein